MLAFMLSIGLLLPYEVASEEVAEGYGFELAENEVLVVNKYNTADFDIVEIE